MAGLIRRLAIYATIEGLVLQAHGNLENTHGKAVLVDFKNHGVTKYNKPSAHHTDGLIKLEAHGLLGLLNVANLSFLIAITKREEVARILDKPIYLITDVAILPLSSRGEAEAAIKLARDSSDHEADDSESGFSDNENEGSSNYNPNLATTPGDDMTASVGKNTNSTKVAEEVARGTVSFGRFATQWLSKRQPAGTSSPQSSDTSKHEPKPASNDDAVLEDLNEAKESQRRSNKGSQAAATLSLLPRILRTTSMLLRSGSYFFSYDIDLTRRMNEKEPLFSAPKHSELNLQFFWNRSLGSRILECDADFLVPVIQGFVGQRSFSLSRSQEGTDRVESALDPELQSSDDNSGRNGNDQQSMLLTLISRRSIKRSGLRYLRRGIDDEGNVANFAESEQVLSCADWNHSFPTTSYLQIRGSIPVYFSQSPYSFKPVVIFHNTQQANQSAFQKHFSTLRQTYGRVQIAMLVDRHGNEKPIGEAYQKAHDMAIQDKRIQGVSFEWFDFHAECRGMKFENISRLIGNLQDFLTPENETIVQQGELKSKQSGVIRTNCMDCLDRTNVAQSAFAQHMLQRSLEKQGYSIDFTRDPGTNWFNTLWADNGDAISRQYAGTAALKGDFTRTRKRNWRGAMNDFGLTLTRYYSNMVNDYFSQAVIDVLLGNIGWKTFEDFESTMMSVDPGISVQSGREAAIDTCSKIVIQNPEQEELIHAWTMLVPNQENTLRTLPFEEAVVLLTDAALYCCKMDWSTEKVARYEKVDLRSIKSLKWGTYITSTFTERQMDETLNKGLLVCYTPGKGDLVRVNTRSLQNVQVPEGNDRQGFDGGTGILSWVAASVAKQAPVPDRVMALKVALPSDDDILSSPKSGTPAQIAESVCDEIRRAIYGSDNTGEQQGQNIVEKADIISAAEARKRVGYLEQVGHSLKKFVWA